LQHLLLFLLVPLRRFHLRRRIDGLGQVAVAEPPGIGRRVGEVVGAQFPVGEASSFALNDQLNVKALLQWYTRITSLRGSQVGRGRAGGWSQGESPMHRLLSVLLAFVIACGAGCGGGTTATTPVAVPVPRSARARRSRHAPPMRTAASPGPLPPLVGRSGSAAQPRMRASRVRAPAQAPVLPIAPVRKCRRARRREWLPLAQRPGGVSAGTGMPQRSEPMCRPEL